MTVHEYSLAIEGVLNVPLTLSRIPLWGDPLVNNVSQSMFSRVTVVAGVVQTYEVRFAPDQPKELVVSCQNPATYVRDHVVIETRRIFGLDNDLAAFYDFASHDEVLKSATNSLCGMRLSCAPDGFEMLASAICAQQVNGKFAGEVRAAVIRRFGVRCDRFADRYAFPGPATVATALPADFEGLRLSKRKVEYLRSIAAAYESGRLDDWRLRSCDRDAALDQLTKIPGIGRWTAEWYLLRVSGRRDICPTSDLVVRKAIAAFYGDRPVDSIVGRWGEYASYATEYLISAYKRGLLRNLGAGA